MMLRLPIAALVLLVAFAGQTHAQTFTWGQPGDGNWNNSSNWQGGAVPTSGTGTTLVFNADGSTGYTATNDFAGTFTLNQLLITNTGSGSIALAGNTLAFGGNSAALSVNSGVPTTISNAVIYSANTTVTNSGSSPLSLTGAQTFAANTTTTFTGSGNINLSAGAVLTPSLTFQSGSSIVYTGSGVLSVGPQGVNGTLNNIVFANNGTYSFTNGVQGGGSTGTLSMGDNSSGGANTTLLYAPATGVTLNFSNFSSGTLSIGNMAGLAGTMNILAGTVRFGVSSGPAINTGGDLLGNNLVLNVASGATFDFNGNAETMGAISGAGTIRGANMNLQLVGNFTWAGNIATNSLTLGVAGVNYTFTGTNTSTGSITISAGASLALGDGGSSGSVAGSIANSGSLIFNRSDNTTYSAVISGAGTVIKQGSGTLTLSGANIYTGSTTVAAGTLAIANAAALPTSTAPVTVASGAVLDLSAAGGYTFGAGRTLTVGRSGTPANDVLGNVTVGGTLDIGGVNTARTATFGNDLTLNGATIRFDLSNTPASNNDQVAVAGNLTLTGTNSLSINQISGTLGSGNYTLFTYSGSLSGDVNNLSLAGIPSGTTRQTFAFNTATAGTILLAVTGNSSNLTWTGSAGNTWDLKTTASWSGGADGDNRFYNLDTVTFGDGGATTVNLTGILTPNSVTVNASQDYTFANGGGGSIAGIGGLTKSGTGTLTIATANTYTGGTIVNAGTLAFSAGGSIVGPLTINGGTVSTVTGAISGDVTINNGGVLSVNSQNNLSTTSAVTFNGGTLRITGAYSIGANSQVFTFNSGGGTIEVADGVTAVKNGDSFIGSGTLNKTGGGTLSIGSAGGGEFTGDVNVNNGSLRFTSQRLTNAGNFTIASGTTLWLLDTTSFTPTTQFAIGAGKTLTLSGDGFQGGGAFRHTLDEAGSATAGINVPITLAATSRFTFVNRAPSDTVTDTFNQPISGPGGLIKDGDGTMVINAAASYAGSTIVSNGTLRISGGNNRLPTGSLLQLGEASSSNSGVFDLNGNSQTVAGLTTAGTGTGHQVINSSATAGTLTVNYGGALPQTFAGQLGGTGTNFGLAKTGSGTQILTGDNTYTGGTTVTAGTLLVNNATGSGTGTGAVTVSGGTLGGTGRIDGAVTIAAGGAIRGGAPDGTGTLTVANNVTVNSTASANGVLRVEASRTGAGTADAGLIAITGSGILNLNPGAGNKFTIDLVNGTSVLQAGETYHITLATVETAGNIQLNGVSLAANATIDPSSYVLQSSAFEGFTGVSLAVNDTRTGLVLTFAPVPEPTTVLGFAAGVLGLGSLVRRRLRKLAPTV